MSRWQLFQAHTSVNLLTKLTYASLKLLSMSIRHLQFVQHLAILTCVAFTRTVAASNPATQYEVPTAIQSLSALLCRQPNVLYISHNGQSLHCVEWAN